MIHRRAASRAFVLWCALVVGCSAGGGGGTGTGTGTGSGSGGEQNTTQNTFDNDGGALEPSDGGGITMATDAGLTVVADSGSTAYVAQPGADFPIAAMRLSPTADARNADARVDVELRADGTLYSHGQQFGQLSGRRVISPNGRELLAVAVDGTVSIGGTPTRARMRDDGDTQMPTGAILTFSDDGRPIAIGPNQPREPGPAQGSGFSNERRRTAALLAIIAATIAPQ